MASQVSEGCGATGSGEATVGVEGVDQGRNTPSITAIKAAAAASNHQREASGRFGSPAAITLHMRSTLALDRRGST